MLDEEINELAEVLVDDIELSGFLQSDINKISVKEVERKKPDAADFERCGEKRPGIKSI